MYSFENLIFTLFYFTTTHTENYVIFNSLLLFVKTGIYQKLYLAYKNGDHVQNAYIF